MLFDDENEEKQDLNNSETEDSAEVDADNKENEDVQDEETAENTTEEENDTDSSKDLELEKRYLSLYAEYENFRKRSVKEKEALYADAVAEVSSNWLLLLDNIDRAITANKDVTADTYENVIQGVEMLGKQAQDIIAKIGIEEIECARGTEFNPELHEAVMHIEDEELGEQQIANVFQKGFIYKGKVIRHAVVQVAN
ncbi:MAG: nucleotide exchange factor GrpE [Clostridia bacterium]|nr:nucleotide exchange factor GrpE [Clostridia bacterium]